MANGSHSFIPPVEGKDKEGVFSLRGLDDVKSIQDYASKSKRGIVIGGGLLGLEAANSLKKLGLEVTVVEFFDRLLPRQLDKEGSQVLRKIIEKQGVKLLLGVQVEKILGEKRVDGCKIKEGEEIDTSFVLFSAGVRSNIQLAKSIDLEVDKAIVVDKYMQTSEKDIYAAGDVCQYNNKSFAIWPIAIEQGKIAGKNIMGERKAYQEITPSNMLNVMDSKVFSIGDIGAGEEYETLKVTSEEDHIFKKLFFMKGNLVGAVLINDISMAGKLKDLIGKDKDYSSLLREDISQEEKIQQL